MWKKWGKRLMAGVVASGMLLSGAVGTASESAVTAREAEWQRLSELLSTYYGEWTDTAYEGLFNNQIPDTALLGNGDVGVASGGDAQSKTFYISKSDFWAYNGSPLPIGGVTLRGKEKTASAVSLAEGKAVVASSAHPDFPASRAVSGNWSNGYEGWVSNVGNPQYLTIDLGAVTTFDRIVLRHDAAARPTETANVTRAFTVSAGNSTDNLQIIYETTANTAAVSDITLDEAISARYVRLDVTKGTQETTDDSRQNPRARIGQFELYNTAEQDVGDNAPKPNAAFNEKQRIVDATVETSMALGGGDVSMETYIMPEQNLLITALTSKCEFPLSLEAVAWAKADASNRPVTATAAEDTVTVTRRTGRGSTSDKAAYFSEAALRTKVIGAAVQTTADTAAGSGTLSFVLKPQETVHVVTAIAGGGQTYDNTGKLKAEAKPAEQAATLMETVSAMLDTTKATHDAWWRDYWLQSYIQLDTTDRDLATVQKYYYGAQYMLGCMIREDTVAPGLYGIWHTTDTPSWNGDYHLNYNFISTFYGVFSSNRPEQARSAIQAILDYMPAAEAAAGSVTELKKVNADFVQMKIEKGDIDPQKGIEGALLYPVGIGPYGMILDRNYHNQALNGAFSATLLTSYYHYSGDREFLPTMYDYLKKCARFYEAWLEREGDKYVLYAGYNEGSWAKNSAAELAMLKHVLTEAIAAAKTLDVDEDKQVLWQEILDHLPAQPIATFSGREVLALAEEEYANGRWSAMTNPVPGDGNIIPMESVLPAGVLGYYSAEEDLALMKNTIDVFSARGAWGQNNNFPKVFPIAVRARYDANVIVRKLAEVIRQKQVANLRISDNTHGAEKAGATQAVNEMLLLSDSGVIKLFGNWPTNKSASFTRLRAAGGVVVSASYDGAAQTVTEATLTAENNGAVTVAAVWESMQVLDSGGKEVATTVGHAPNHPDEATYTFEAKAGEAYMLINATPLLLGDVDENGKVNTSDARRLLQYAAGVIDETALDLRVADVDGNDKYNTSDARCILQKAAGLLDKFPAEEK